MIKTFNYKTRNYLLYGCIILLGYLAYSFAIKKTFNEVSLQSELKIKSLQVQNINSKIAGIQNQLNQLEKNIGSDKSGNDYPPILFEFFSKYCSNNNLLINDISKPLIDSTSHLKYSFVKLSVDGNFLDCIKLAFQTEQVENISRIASLNFCLIDDNRLKKKILRVTYYLQNYLEE